MTDMRMTENSSKWEKIRQRFRRGKKTQATQPEELFADLPLPRPQTPYGDRHQLERSEPQSSLYRHPRPLTRRDLHRPQSPVLREHLLPSTLLASELIAAGYTREHYLDTHSPVSPRRSRARTESQIWAIGELEEGWPLQPAPPSSPPASPSPPKLVIAGFMYENYLSRPIPGYGTGRSRTESGMRSTERVERYDSPTDPSPPSTPPLPPSLGYRRGRAQTESVTRWSDNEATEEDDSLAPSTPSPSSTPSPPALLFEPAPPFKEVLQAQSRNYRWTQSFTLLRATQWSEDAKTKFQQVGTSEAIPEEDTQEHIDPPQLNRSGPVRIQRKRDHCVEDPSCPCTDDDRLLSGFF
ncbi:uncharacterized protein PAC_16908 [Phialocephala subalpina]|uniref:Uncharacterized protein n=1 Tax=Phialocephala subalpina TaxID=576137 RepID=A0A1L7XPQ2_9HELO|nr:uncharacterized protein PAC_16908 [Phialocephala subalpina]